jgi:DNA ligase-associated metallophosphoesterase
LESAFNFHFLDQHLVLLPEKGIYWQEKKMLLISDLHLGKVGHFRKEGIAVPSEMIYHDYETLTNILHTYQVDKLVVLGDFSHSDYNKELLLFSKWKNENRNLEVILVMGNHDILPYDFYSDLNIQIVESRLSVAPFIFSHKPITSNKTKLYNIAGHIHPSVVLKGKGRQELKLCCFFFGKKYGLLPAFGKFTGTAKIQVRAGEEVFVVLKDRVCKV